MDCWYILFVGLVEGVVGIREGAVDGDVGYGVGSETVFFIGSNTNFAHVEMFISVYAKEFPVRRDLMWGFV